jgi:uncharacterized protein YdeI (BOF family)
MNNCNEEPRDKPEASSLDRKFYRGICMKRKIRFCMILGIFLLMVGCDMDDILERRDPVLITAAEADGLRDGTPVILRGYILVGDTGWYPRTTFKDIKGGEIIIKIDDDLYWIVNSIGRGDLVEIKGEVDREIGRTEIDVEWISKIS